MNSEQMDIKQSDANNELHQNLTRPDINQKVFQFLQQGKQICLNHEPYFVVISKQHH